MTGFDPVDEGGAWRTRARVCFFQGFVVRQIAA